MAKPNWGRGIGMGLSSLGQSMMDRAMMEQRWRQAQELEAESARLDAERDEARHLRDNPYTVPGAMIDRLRYGSAVPVGIPGYQPQDGRTNLQGLLGINRALAPEPVEPVDPMKVVVGADDPMNPFGVPAEMGDIVLYQRQITFDKNKIRTPGGGGDSPYPSGINTTEANRLGTRYFGNLSPTGAGQAGVSAPREIIDMTAEGILPIDRARADWFGALEGGLVGPYQQAQADSIVQEHMPPMDLGPLGLDEWTGGGFVDKKPGWIKDKSVTVDAARAKLSGLLAKSANKDLTWAMVRNALREMGLSDAEIAETLPKVGAISAAPDSSAARPDSAFTTIEVKDKNFIKILEAQQ